MRPVRGSAVRDGRVLGHDQAPLAQLAEQLTLNQRVHSSSLWRCTQWDGPPEGGPFSCRRASSSSHRYPSSVTRAQGQADRRLLRGVTLGTAILGITLAGHAAGGGHLPAFGYYAALLPIAVILSIAAASRRRSPFALVALAISLQVLLHVLLVVIGAHGTHGVRIVPSALMLTVHLGAAVVVGWALAHGDALMDRWLDFWQAFTTAFLTYWQPAAPELGQISVDQVSLAPRASLLSSIARRGPPLA